jgi:Holliday junction DNA helicase RuvA
MIGSLRGRVLEREAPGEVLVEVAGVGYRVHVSPRTLAVLVPETDVFLHVHHHMREDGQALYGFLGRDERMTFEALISAHGVGPALALAALSVHTPEQLRAAVRAGDLDALCLVPGVGKKTAARLLLELKARLDDAAGDELAAVASAPGGNGHAPRPAVADVREALAGLGYGSDEIRDVLRELPAEGDAESLLREALRHLAAQRA